MSATTVRVRSCREAVSERWETAAAIGARAGIPEATARRRLELLRATGVVQRAKRGGERWRLVDVAGPGR